MPSRKFHWLLQRPHSRDLQHFPPQSTSVLHRILVHAVLLSAFIVTALTLLAVLMGGALVHNRILAQLTSSVAIREDQLSQALQFDRERTSILAAKPEVRSLLSSQGESLVGLWESLRFQDPTTLGMAVFNARREKVTNLGQALPLPEDVKTESAIVPTFDRDGHWEAIDVFAPVRDARGRSLGLFAIRYELSQFLSTLSINPALGATVQLTLERGVDGTYSFIYSSVPQPFTKLSIPGIDQFSGTVEGTDDRGIAYIASHRLIPALGWQMVLMVARDDAMSGWEYFARVLLCVDVVLVLLSIVVGVILARQISAPLLSLAEKIRLLHPDQWHFRRTIRTGDEVETLDYAVSELTQRLRFAMRHLDRMKSDFLALASHDLRTPLSTLRWYVQLLQQDRDASKKQRQEYMAQIEHASAHMATLLDQLFHVVQMEEQGVRTEKSQADLRTLFTAWAKEWRASAHRKNVRTDVQLPAHSCRMQTDVTALQRIMSNLVGNALKYSRSGGLVRVTVVSTKKEVTITVADNGIGIPKEEQPHIFEKFFRAKNATQSDVSGTGLGLHVTKALVESLGGRISFRSSPGKGTTFTVRFPLQ